MARREKAEARVANRPQAAAESGFGPMLTGGMIAGAMAGVVDGGIGATAGEAERGGNRRSDRPDPDRHDAASATPGAMPTPAAAPTGGTKPDQPVARHQDEADPQPMASASPARQGGERHSDHEPDGRGNGTSQHAPPADRVEAADTGGDAASPNAAAPAPDLSARVAEELTTSLTHLVERLAVLPASATGEITAALDDLVRDLSQELTASASRISSELTAALEMSTGAFAGLGDDILDDAGLALTSIAIPPALLGAETMELALTPLSIALGAEVEVSPRVAVEAGPLAAEMSSANEIAIAAEAGFEMASAGLTSIGFAGLSYLETAETDPGAAPTGHGWLHGFI